ncbi:phage head morphogenesis protein [Acinetobacter sp. ANC 4558]|uniref:minor capsid protein n=1 Tax=Acinetobacter sp. ANC 4558 TaxID=1977876 RepID=UPI000A34FB50|nr:minor capsid protein [Acinetobacter sp. ANC 4558]OTG85541.1 phage head morphogenesis protein [Acinetobacter sp. ANC 4558]
MAKNKDDSLLDSIIRHQAYLYRLSSHEVMEILKQFNRESNAMVSQLRDLLDELSESEKTALSGARYTTVKLKEVKRILDDWQDAIVTALPESFAVSGVALSVYEANYQAKILGKKIKEPQGEKIFNQACKKPFSGGALIDQMFTDMAENTRRRVEYAIRDGISQGQTNQQITQRIKGTSKLKYEDGILNQSRQSIDMVVRTARSHVSNTAYDETYRALGVKKLKVSATLDGRTCKFCASEDGKVYDIDDPSRPQFPVHPRNRTVYVPYVENEDEKFVGKRPYVIKPGDAGQVSANTDFKEWFAVQDESFQREWLGKKRFELYKNGDYTIEKFLDPEGKLYTLKELEALDKQTFKGLGL